ATRDSGPDPLVRDACKSRGHRWTGRGWWRRRQLDSNRVWPAGESGGELHLQLRWRIRDIRVEYHAGIWPDRASDGPVPEVHPGRRCTRIFRELAGSDAPGVVDVADVH